MLFPVAVAVRTTQTTLGLCVKCVTYGSRLLRVMPLNGGAESYGKGRQTSILGGSMRLKNKDLLKASETVERVVGLTLSALAEAKNENISDDDLVLQLWHNFMQQTKESSIPAASMHMAMSCYKLALAADEVHSLREQLDFHKDAIDMLTELGGFD
jgi:hypothetical protein